MRKKINLILFLISFYFFFVNNSQANTQAELINKYKTTDTLSFNFVQSIGDKIETGNCYIKYPLLMKCEYPKKKKSIIANGKKFAIIKRRYKKVYYYPLKKTPLFYLLNKENVLNVIQNYKPSLVNSDVIEFELTDSSANKIKIFFDKNSLKFKGWETKDAYSNDVSFIISNLRTNELISDNFFKIPKEEDL